MNHQFSLFGFIKPNGKVPISAERIAEAKKQIAEGNGKGAAATLREIRYKLEDYEKRIKNRENSK